jgi:sugar phosphate isomerase/epimerase
MPDPIPDLSRDQTCHHYQAPTGKRCGLPCLPPVLSLRPMTNSLSRRTLLRTGALAAAATLLPSESQGQAQASLHEPSAATALPIRLGIASYTFRSFDSAHLIDFMHQLKTPLLNLKDVHLAMTPLDQVANQAAAYRAAGFKLTAAGNITFAKDDDDDIRPKFEYLKAAGIPIAVCAPTHENLPRLDKFVKEYNIKLAIHNHGPEDKNFPSPFDVLTAVKNLDPRIGLCIDLGHSLRAGADVVAAIHAAGPRLYDIHIKDLADATAKESQVAVGEGVMPVRAVFQALIDTHYAGNVDLEYEIFPKDPMPGVVESFAHMRGVLAGMGYK